MVYSLSHCKFNKKINKTIFKLNGKVGIIVLKSKHTRVFRNNQHIHGTSICLLFSLEYVPLYHLYPLAQLILHVFEEYCYKKTSVGIYHVCADYS